MDLITAFGQFGEVIGVMRQRNGTAKYAFVKFATSGGVDAALKSGPVTVDA